MIPIWFLTKKTLNVNISKCPTDDRYFIPNTFSHFYIYFHPVPTKPSPTPVFPHLVQPSRTISPPTFTTPPTGFHLRSPKHFYIVWLFSTRICEPIVQPHIIMQTGLRIVRIDTNVHHKGWPYRGCTTNRGYSCCYICVNKKIRVDRYKSSLHMKTPDS